MKLRFSSKTFSPLPLRSRSALRASSTPYSLISASSASSRPRRLQCGSCARVATCVVQSTTASTRSFSRWSHHLRHHHHNGRSHPNGSATREAASEDSRKSRKVKISFGDCKTVKYFQMPDERASHRNSR